ncbi:hypothetical protein ACHAWX_007492 [Stephanocyclus meneghinianus]
MSLRNIVSINSANEIEITDNQPRLPLPSSSAPSDLLRQWNALISRTKKPAYQINMSLDRIQTPRTQLCEWAYHLVDHCNIDRDIVSVAFSIFDRFVSRRFDKEGVELELLALSCVYTAIKTHSCTGKLSSSSVAKLSRRSDGAQRFTVEQIEDMEFHICEIIDWHVNPPTPTMFLDVGFALIEACVIDDCRRGTLVGVKDLAVFLVEISVIDIYFSTFSPSSVASAAILVATKALSAPQAMRNSIHILEQDTLETSQCALRLSQHYQNWQSSEENKQIRWPCASPTGVDLIEDSSLEEGSNLESVFEEVVADEERTSVPATEEGQDKRGAGSKRKRGLYF